eukprot:368309-Pyramimonas_sp.AAC.1
MGSICRFSRLVSSNFASCASTFGAARNHSGYNVHRAQARACVPRIRSCVSSRDRLSHTGSQREYE